MSDDPDESVFHPWRDVGEFTRWNPLPVLAIYVGDPVAEMAPEKEATEPQSMLEEQS